ncbi:MAG: OmpH family outer membrane protein [Pseudorhodobacter sp.]
MSLLQGRSLALLIAGGLALFPTGPRAQDPGSSLTVPWSDPVIMQGGVVVVDQQVLFENSDFGQESLRLLEARSAELKSENRRIEEALEAEERSLTEKRADLPAEEFRALAEAFDRKVEEIRAAQDAKGTDIARQRDMHQQQFFERAVPIVVELMREKGAVAVLDRSMVVMSLDRIDITAEAIARVNENLTGPAPEDPGSNPAPQSQEDRAPGQP